MKVTLKAHTSLFNGKLDKKETLELAGTNAGICYMPGTLKELEDETSEKKMKRAHSTLKRTHHSVIGHSTMEIMIEGIPKICAMILNNLGEYNTSEKSARYTEMADIDPVEREYYEKWKVIFTERIKEVYGNKITNEKQIEKLAMENARYLISVFIPTIMAYTTSVRQFNYIIDWCRRMYKEETTNPFFKEVAKYMNEFADAIEDIVYIENLRDTKNRQFNLFNKNESELDNIQSYYSYSYQTTYFSSFALLAQAQRHRTIDYVAYFDGRPKSFYIPPIIQNTKYEDMMMEDYRELAKLGKVPQGTVIGILEMGTVDNFILKTKERECGCAQLEIQRQVVETHDVYETLATPQAVKDKFEGYKKHVRCGFDDFKCVSPCMWGQKSLERLI